MMPATSSPREDGGTAGRGAAARGGVTVEHAHRCGTGPACPRPPAPAVHLVGREEDVAVACGLLLDPRVRLLTLTGPGGVGKTSLSLAVAASVVDAFRHGVAVVDLAPLTDPALLAGAIGRALALRESGREPMSRTLPRYLGDRQVLLVLDNVEHLLAAAPQVAALLAACPAVRVLATSRVPLGLPGEHELPVLPLALPDPHARPEDLGAVAAVAMFVRCVQAAAPGWRLTPATTSPAVEICRRLDGLPLALELAAARVKSLGVEQVLHRLRDRFRLLAVPDRVVPERHRSLRGAVDWSYDLLGEAEQALFCALSVFAGGWELSAAEAVCAGHQAGAGSLDREDVVDLLGRLVDHSMVQVEQRADRPRYRLLETLREYAAQHLGAADAQQLRQRHRAWFLELAVRAEAAVGGAEEASWLDRLELDHDNLRAALDHSESPGVDVEPGLRLAGALPRFWDVRGYLGEGYERVERLLLIGAADEVSVGRATAHNALGTLAMARGEQASARTALEHSAHLGHELGDLRLEAWPQSMLAFQAFLVQDYPRGRRAAERALALAELARDEVLLVRGLAARGVIAWMQDDRAAGWSLLEQSVVRMRALGATWGTGNVLHLMGWLSWLAHDAEQAGRLEREAVSLLWSLGDRHTVAHAIDVLACVATGTGQPERGARLLGVSGHLRDTTGGSRPPYLDAECARAAAGAVARLGSDRFDACWSAGRDAALQEAVGELLAEPGKPPDDPAGPLTRREREVAQHVVAGLTNRQIAAALTISERTAERHLENVRVKLGVSSRAQVAAWAVQHPAP